MNKFLRYIYFLEKGEDLEKGRRLLMLVVLPFVLVCGYPILLLDYLLKIQNTDRSVITTFFGSMVSQIVGASTVITILNFLFGADVLYGAGTIDILLIWLVAPLGLLLLLITVLSVAWLITGLPEFVYKQIRKSLRVKDKY